jgi:hypothetical protein
MAKSSKPVKTIAETPAKKAVAPAKTPAKVPAKKAAAPAKATTMKAK